LRCVRDEKGNRLQGDEIEYVLLDLGGKIQGVLFYFIFFNYIFIIIRIKNIKVIKKILFYSGVTSIDITGVETLVEIRKTLEVKDIKVINKYQFIIFLYLNKTNILRWFVTIYVYDIQVVLVNPRIEVMEKLILTNFIEKIGKERVFLSIEDAIEGCKFALSPERYL